LHIRAEGEIPSPWILEVSESYETPLYNRPIVVGSTLNIRPLVSYTKRSQLILPNLQPHSGIKNLLQKANVRVTFRSNCASKDLPKPNHSLKKHLKYNV